MNTINKILSDFADINADEYVSNYYEVSIMSENKKDNIFELAKKATYATSNDILELIRLKEWKKEFLICQYPNGESSWFGKIPYGYDLNGVTPKEFIIQQLLNVFKQEPDEVYWIKLDPGGYYACCYEEYLFKTDKGIYFFSMQVHD
ncbi:hypothetical protein ACS2CL_20130 [Bacillus cereus group sp. BceL296]|uniref:hypothetical protein n=1 Tax=Bacillus cereus group TaxID=86661 RepID=UPI00065BACF9|nr:MULTISPECIES: hypothetical protein [Bacillus cereus group]KMQ18723.1 hypothetical protein TU69_19980 [Bacillus cereus]MCU5391900.1 hypothetical protein [Bacillus paranthracis]MDA1624133.1 hypothetical protein [Bacillus cereus group sp. TH206-1LC]MDA1751250.1 hypothetical protein [Bacillus cereus group sp. LD113LC]MDA1822947.1 hypothetical protein [Bacillus cereus group sp. BY2-1LC]